MSEKENPESSETKDGKEGSGNGTDQGEVTVTVQVRWPTHP